MNHLSYYKWRRRCNTRRQSFQAMRLIALSNHFFFLSKNCIFCTIFFPHDLTQIKLRNHSRNTIRIFFDHIIHGKNRRLLSKGFQITNIHAYHTKAFAFLTERKLSITSCSSILLFIHFFVRCCYFFSFLISNIEID